VLVPRMDRRAFLLGTTGALGLSACQTRSPHRAAAPPNILLITADDLGPHLGCYGDSTIATPHLDRLAGEGVRFDRAYVTQASCSPSRSSIFTGLYPHQNGQIGLSHVGAYEMRSGLPTLPALLSETGYRTGVIGKIHVAPESAVPFGWRSTLKVRETLSVSKVAEEAARFLRERDRAPFFLMVNFMDPHRPFTPQVDGVPERPVTGDEVTPFAFLGLDTPRIREEVAGYYNSVARLDAGVGLLFEELAQSGHSRDTIVMVLGDHGPPFTRSKTTCYEAGLHVPLLVRWPRVARPGLTSDALVSTVDILPTLLAAAGVDAPATLPGESLVPLLRGRRTHWRTTLCAEFNSHGVSHFFPRRSIRDDRYKLILNLLPDRPNPIRAVDGCAAWAASRDSTMVDEDVRRAYDTYHRPPAVELYDLIADPHEFHNLAGSEEHAGVTQGLMRQLHEWRRRTDDPYLDPARLSAAARQSPPAAVR